MKSGDILFFYGESDIGLVRNENQDSYIFFEINNSFFLAAVFDGMGGLSSGLIASTLAKEKLTEYLTCALREQTADKLSNSQIKDIIFDAVVFTSYSVYSHSINSSLSEGMGTTVAAILLTPKKAYIFHVGDSRVYAMALGKLLPLTHDHTLVNYLVDTKVISKDEAENHPQRHILTKAIGTEGFVSPDISVVSLSKISSFLLCSDGLTLHSSDSEIASVLNREQTPKEKVEALISLTKERGANDNVTVLSVLPSGKEKIQRKEHS